MSTPATHPSPTGAFLARCILGLAVLPLAACLGNGSQPEQDALARVRAEGKLVVAYADERPFGYLDSTSGRVTGEAPEIARVVAERLGVAEVEPVLTEWKSLIPGLQAGRFDCIAAGMYITPERAANVAFSDPTYRIGEAFLVAAGNPQDLHAFADIAANPETRLGVVRGTVEHGYARELGIPEEQIVVFEANDAAVAGLRGGQIDAFAGTALTIADIVRRLGADAGVEAAKPFTQPVIDGRPAWGYGAFAFRPDDTGLRDAFNEELQGFLGSAEHRELVAPFGFGPGQLPQGKTLDEVLSAAAATTTTP